MDNEPVHSPLPPEPSDRRVLYSAIAWVGVILMFVFIVLITYAPNRSTSLDAANVTTRLQIRKQVDDAQKIKATTYQWINQAEGQVRLPLEQARNLLIKELQDAKTGD